MEAIYDLVCNSKEELKEIKEQIKNDKELVGSTLNEALIKQMIKNGNYQDDEDDDDDGEEEEVKLDKNENNSINN